VWLCNGDITKFLCGWLGSIVPTTFWPWGPVESAPMSNCYVTGFKAGMCFWWVAVKHSFCELHCVWMSTMCLQLVWQRHDVVFAACVTRKSCTECIEASLTIAFQCQWCPSVGRCSDGLDRRRQEWQEQSCDKNVCNLHSSHFTDLVTHCLILCSTVNR